jgi:hypothetical protein
MIIEKAKNLPRLTLRLETTVKVNVVMRKIVWIVRAQSSDGRVYAFSIPPSTTELMQHLDEYFPHGNFQIDYVGFFEIF